MKLLELLPAELDAATAATAPLFLPFGTVEWHSDHLPLGLDTLVAEAACQHWAGAVGVVAPATSWGIGGVPFPGTVRLNPEVMERHYRDLFGQCAHLGFQRLCAVPGHYGLEQLLTLKRAAFQHQQQWSGVVLVCPVYELTSDLGYDGVDHAGAVETSLLLWARADLVDARRLGRPDVLEGVIGRDPRGGQQGAGRAADPCRRGARLGTAGRPGRVCPRTQRVSGRTGPPGAGARPAGPRARPVAEGGGCRRSASPPYLEALQHLADGNDTLAKAALNLVWTHLLDALQGES